MSLNFSRLNQFNKLYFEPSGSTLDRAELFEALHVLLVEAARRGPLLLVVEDAHWADQSTRDMLSFLFSRPVPGAGLVVSYRADDLHRRHPLRRQVETRFRANADGFFVIASRLSLVAISA